MSVEVPKNHVLLVFGATGDLAQKKLLPALARLVRKGKIGESPIVCIGRRNISRDEYIDIMDVHEGTYAGAEQLKEQLHYYSVDIKEDDPEEFAQFIQELSHDHNCNDNLAFYFALPNVLFKPAADFLNAGGLLNGPGDKKVAFEKPFGQDLESAQELHEQLTQLFNEEQIYRVDHYLGKELIENVLVFRFANAMFEHIWCNSCIDHVQVTLAEEFGAGGRADYYDTAGHVRDVVQSHILQALALTAMERPASLDPEDIRDAKHIVLNQLQPVTSENVVLGQYGSGKVKGEQVNGYRQEEDVPADSNTETFAAFKTYVDTDRWQNVPFYVRTGKRLDGNYVEINVVLNDISSQLFEEHPQLANHDVIRIRLKPDEGIHIQFHTKQPETRKRLELTSMDFCYPCTFGTDTPEAYESVFHELLKGDHTIFVRWDEIQASWRFTDTLLQTAVQHDYTFPNYTAGKGGPEAAINLIEKDKRTWLTVENKRE